MAATTLIGVRPPAGCMPEPAHRRRRRQLQSFLVLCVVVLGLILATPLAHAEEVFTGQAAAANAADSTWIAGPAQRAAVCIVDTGNGNAAVNNPDLANVVARYAVDGSSDASDLDDTGHHGTLMSMIATAPYDGFGMVGIAPSVNVVAVRATRPGGGTAMAWPDVFSGVDWCTQHRTEFNIKVVSLSLGVQSTYGPLTQDDETTMQNAIDWARHNGLDVVAAAGNHPGLADWPALYAPVLSVGAADNTGARCSFSASGSGVDLYAPGCPLDVALPDGQAAWASGTSEATVLVAGVLAQLRGLRPDLTNDQAEYLLTSSARLQDAGSTLDAGATFRAAGLGAELTQGHGAIPDLRPASSSTPASSAPTPGAEPAPAVMPPTVPPVSPVLVTLPRVAAPRVRLSKPRVRWVRYRHGELSLVFTNKPAGAQARVQMYACKRGNAFPTLARSLRIRGDRLRTRVSGTLSQVSITYVDPQGRRGMSAPLSLHP